MSVMTDLIYGWDFVVGAITTMVYMMVQIIWLNIIFNGLGTKSIAGFDQWQMYFVLIVNQFIWAFIFGLVWNNYRLLAEKIYLGYLDFAIIRPINTFFISFFSRITTRNSVIMIFYSLILLPYVLGKSNLSFDLVGWGQIFFVIFSSVVLIACMYIISGIIEFYKSRFFGFKWFMESTDDINRYPKQIYPGYLQWMFTYLWPLFLATAPLYDVLSRKFGWQNYLEIGLMSIVFILITSLMWSGGLKRYQSAA